MDRIRKEYIRGTVQVGQFRVKTREARLGRYGHLRMKDDGYIGRRLLRMKLPGKWKRGRPKGGIWMQKIEQNGDGKSVAIPNGGSRFVL